MHISWWYFINNILVRHVIDWPTLLVCKMKWIKMSGFETFLLSTCRAPFQYKDNFSRCMVYPFHSLWPSEAIWQQRSSVKSTDIHIRAISLEMPQPAITKICLKFTYLKFDLNFPGANELMMTWSHSCLILMMRIPILLRQCLYTIDSQYILVK